MSSVNKMNSNKQMWLLLATFTILLLTLMCPVNGRLVDTDLDTVTEVVARCRATCLEKFLFGSDSNDIEMPIDACHMQSNCWMCWDFCQFLHKEKRAVIKSMCSNSSCVSIHCCYYLEQEPAKKINIVTVILIEIPRNFFHYSWMDANTRADITHTQTGCCTLCRRMI